MLFTYIDGDNIGLKIEKSFLDNNELSLKEVNENIKILVDRITKYLIGEKQEIIFSGADGIICKGEDLNTLKALEYIRRLDNTITFSLGIGYSLRDSYIALRYAKSLNKDIAVILIENNFSIVR